MPRIELTIVYDSDDGLGATLLRDGEPVVMWKRDHRTRAEYGRILGRLDWELWEYPIWCYARDPADQISFLDAFREGYKRASDAKD